MKRLAALVALACLASAPPSHVKQASDVSPLALTAEYWTKSPTSPPWCLSEDDFHERDWYGSYSGTFTATEHFCTNHVDVYNGYEYFDGGGVGVVVYVSAVGTLNSLTITGQDKFGTPYQPQAAVLLSSSVSGHGRNAYTTNHYAVCVFPGGQQGIGILSGDQTMTLSGSFSQLSIQLVAEMFSFSVNNQYPVGCPEGQKPPGS